ncbi:hypothetical protein KP509_12G054800 [Ceratopteris richardii]|uniref:Uncharacterized protein n=1 Tax=Ceratopteris richardii TaxID=49495 RepID=A0A8T2TSA7_CERRI|nr:hypothetical protein KP509_12G054800 [Ceratopteris richardii]
MNPDNSPEPLVADDTIPPDNSERYAGRPSRGRWRKNPTLHQGIFGKGSRKISSLSWLLFVAENQVEVAVKKNSPDSGALDAVSGLSSSMQEVRESRGYRYRQVSNSTIAGGNETKQLNRPASECSTGATRNMQLTKNVPTTPSRTKSLLKKYEVENPEDAAYIAGVVFVLEQPGIETSNDKDDFLKVRSKYKLL